MPKIENIEKRIRSIEGFDVRLMKDGKNVRGDMELATHYENYEHAAKNDSTVKQWKETRFVGKFPGFEVDVLDADGTAVNGNTKLSTVRETYNKK